MILYILAFIVMCIICFFAYIKVKHRFWAMQPVFHFYDLYYWLFNVGIIRHDLPKKNRYTNFKNISFAKMSNLLDKTNKQMKQFVFLIQQHYLKNKENRFHPEWINIAPYFVGHKHPCFVSFYYEPKWIEDVANKTIIEDKQMIGAITSRPLQLFIYKKNTQETLVVYYVDYLCVDKSYRKKNIAPQLIQTHEYHQSHTNTDICVSLFKREGEMTGIIPLCCYKTYCFNMRKWTTPLGLPATVSLLDADSQNVFYAWEFIKETIQNSSIWKITILPQISNIIELIKTNNLFLKIVMIDQAVQAIYFFRKVCTSISEGKEVLSCFASMKSIHVTPELFIHAFKVSVASIVKKYKFSYLTVENISNNDILITNLCNKSIPEIVSPTAYFLYNFAYQTIPSNKILIIN